VIEVGPGLGDLAASAMEAAGPMGPALRWRFVEQFERVRGWQRRRLGRAAASAAWSSALGEAPPVTGCLLANEVLDAFPVHVLEVGPDQGMEEVYVDVEEGRFVERLGPLSREALAGPAERAAKYLAEGDRFEICPGFDDWFREASRVIRRGYLLLIDYGDEEPDIWLRTPHGSLESPGPADLGPSPLEAPGRKDITARVDFTAALESALAAGFSPLPLVTQRAWLRSLGLDEVAEELDLARLHASMSGWVEDAVEIEDELEGLHDLTTAGELGDLLVLRAVKHAPVPWSAGGV
jgi:SAM-dependent MidA family methyltransferase